MWGNCLPREGQHRPMKTLTAIALVIPLLPFLAGCDDSATTAMSDDAGQSTTGGTSTSDASSEAGTSNPSNSDASGSDPSDSDVAQSDANPSDAQASAQEPVPLGASATFAVLASAEITNIPSSTITVACPSPPSGRASAAP
jgi:hypothetical protein